MITLPPLSAIPADDREQMREAAIVAVETAEALAGQGSNVVAEVMRGQDEFREWDHYPKGDVYDKASCAQYYYHSHNGAADEHGHFHTFIRTGGIPGELTPAPHSGSNAEDWPMSDEIITHFAAISMDHHGVPTHLFTTNRWVTGETVYPAADMAAMLDGFVISENAGKNMGEWQTANRWITAMMRLFRPQIEQLLVLRDEAIAARLQQTLESGLDVYEDKGIELTSICEISIVEQLEWLDMLD